MKVGNCVSGRCPCCEYFGTSLHTKWTATSNLAQQSEVRSEHSPHEGSSAMFESVGTLDIQPLNPDSPAVVLLDSTQDGEQLHLENHRLSSRFVYGVNQVTCQRNYLLFLETKSLDIALFIHVFCMYGSFNCPSVLELFSTSNQRVTY